MGKDMALGSTGKQATTTGFEKVEVYAGQVFTEVQPVAESNNLANTTTSSNLQKKLVQMTLL